MSTEAPTTPTPQPPPRARSRLRWRLWLMGLLVLLGAGAWFAPQVVARTGLRNQLVRDGVSDLRGSVEVGGASFGWLAPIELRDVTVKDAQGRTLLTAARIVSSKTLLALLRDHADLGEFTIDRPTAEIVCEKGTTNLEDAVANFLKGDAPAGPGRPSVSVRLSGGRLTVRDADAGKSWEFDALEAAVGVPASRSEPIAVKVAAATGSPGAVEVDLSLGEGGTAKVAATELPLEPVALALSRVSPGVSLAGRLTANLTVAWGKDDKGRPNARVEGAASARDFELGGPWLKGDRLRLASADLPLKLEVAGKGIRVERADLKCDVGTLSAVGSFDPDDSLDRLVDTPGARVEADVDLARFATLLPRLLRVRPGTAVREGKLALKLASRATPEGTTWDGEVRSSALKATRGGKPFEWAEPLSIEFSGRVPPGHLPTFDKFICRSDCVAINAKGSPDSFRGAANVYLDRLTNRLGEFVDLAGVRLEGEASVWAIVSRSPKGEFKTNGGVELKRFTFTDGGRHGLAEQSLSLTASAEGAWPARGPVRVDTGSVALASGGDTLEVKLLEPIPDARQPTGGKLSAKLTGDLDRWMGRVRRFVRVPQHYAFGGSTTARGTVRFAPGVVAIDGLTLGIEKARFHGAGLALDEPVLNASADLAVNQAAGSTEFRNFQITSPVLTLREGKLAFDLPPDGNLAVSGNGTAVTDFNRLGRTLKLQSDPAGGDALRGRGTGPIRFRWQGDTTTFGATLDVRDFAYGDPRKTGISEPAFRLEFDGQYDERPDRLTINRSLVDRAGFAVDARGAWSKLSTTQDLALNGNLTYDLAVLTPELRNSLGSGFRAAGKGSRPFSFSGSLAPGGAAPGKPPPPSPFGKLTAEGGLGWDAITAYGFDTGRGELKVKVANGVGTVSPIQATFGGGRITLTPTVRLAPDPAELTLAKGKVVDHAKLTPAACAGALGYALPVIANAAQAEGELSAVLDENRVPLADVTKATMKGQIVVHRATVGAGPVVTEIVKLLGQPSARVTLANEMAVPVQVKDGRVYHENLAITVNGYAVKTTGSVGFDGSLAMVADVPIPGTFPGLKNNPVLKKALEGKVVKVPITGTMARPAVDARMFEAAIANFTRNAAKNVGKELFQKEFDRLFPSMPGPPKK